MHFIKKNIINKNLIDIINNINVINTNNPIFDFIKKIIGEKLDFYRLHFNYTIYGKGFEDAKNDFFNHIINK